MIEYLVDVLITLLQGGFTGDLSHAQIDRGSVGNTFPYVRLGTGPVEFSQTVREVPSSQPRPEPIQQKISIDATRIGPYSLAKVPLPGSTLVKLTDAVGRKQLLQEDKDFTLEPTGPTLTLTQDPGSFSHLLVNYTFAGIYTVREFEQALWVEIYHPEALEREKWASLCTTLILTHYDEVLEAFNTHTTEYMSASYLTHHSLRGIYLLRGETIPEGDTPYLRIHFQVQGQLKCVRELTGPVGLIEQVHSPGVSSQYPVDIEVDLG